jgi:hypothetical protein
VSDEERLAELVDTWEKEKAEGKLNLVRIKLGAIALSLSTEELVRASIKDKTYVGPERRRAS